MQKIKNIRFDLYKAVIALKTNYDKHCRQADEKLSAFEAIPSDEWTPAKKRSFAIWSGHKKKLKEAEEMANSPWDLHEVIMAAIEGKLSNTTMDYYGEKIELDKNACFCKSDTPWLISFQISRLRADSLPAKKKIGSPRNDIHLEDDEYIGEFTEVLLDRRFNIVIIQANRYGVGVGVVCKYLNYLYKRYLELTGKTQSKYVIGDLQPILDETLMEKAFNSECIRKIHFRCSDENVDAIISAENQTLGSAVRLIGEQTGVVLDVTLSVKGREPSRSLTTDDIKKAGRDYIKYMNDSLVSETSKKDAKMEFTIWNETESVAESVDLLIPKVNFIVPLLVEERKPIGSEYFYDITVEKYGNLTGRIIALLQK